MNVAERALARVTTPIMQLYSDAPILVLIVPLALGYWGWRQSSHLDDVCQNLFGAFQEVGNPPSDAYQMALEDYVKLFDKLPTLREANRICRAEIYENTERQIELYNTIKAAR